MKYDGMYTMQENAERMLLEQYHANLVSNPTRTLVITKTLVRQLGGTAPYSPLVFISQVNAIFNSDMDEKQI